RGARPCRPHPGRAVPSPTRVPPTGPVTHRDAYALLLVVALIWAGNFPLAKLGLAEIGPMTLAATRALIAAPLLGLRARLLEGPLPPLAPRDLTAVIVLAVTGFVGNSTLWYVGMRFTTPANAGILGAAAPVVGALAAAVWLRRRLSPDNPRLDRNPAPPVGQPGRSHHPRLSAALGDLHALQPRQPLHLLAAPDARGRPRGGGPRARARPAPRAR